MAGWIKLSRDLVYHDLWQETPFSRGQAWVDLILLANHKAGFIRVAGEKIKIERGQCGWSQLRLSKRWGWSRGKVRRFLNDLKTERMIDTKENNRNTIISICNYDKFQSSNNSDSTTDDTPDNTTDGHQTVQQTDTNKNVKKEKNVKEDISTEPLIGSIPTNKKGEVYSVTESFAHEMQELYPAVDVLQEVRKMIAWAKTNPSKRKTHGGMARFINNWLAKQQDKGGSNGNNRPNGEKLTGAAKRAQDHHDTIKRYAQGGAAAALDSPDF